MGITEVFSKVDSALEENKGLISLNDAEKAVYNVMDILAVPVKGYEEYVQSILKEADGNMSSEISLVEFTDAVFQLVKHLGEFQYLYNLNVLNFQFLNVKLPTNSETFAYKYEGSNADAHLVATDQCKNIILYIVLFSSQTFTNTYVYTVSPRAS